LQRENFHPLEAVFAMHTRSSRKNQRSQGDSTVNHVRPLAGTFTGTCTADARFSL
jgi:hypothetical protein